MRVAPLVFVALVGCSGAKDEPPPIVDVGCGERPEIEGVCVGVSAAPVCADEMCSKDVACSRSWSVRDDAALADAAPKAVAGECIVLARGTYRTALKLAGGVHLLGTGASAVTVSGLTFEGAGKSLVRGVAVVGGGVVTRGVAVELDRVSVRASTGYAALAENADLTVTETTIAESAKIGITVRCTAPSGCAAGRRPRLVLRRTWVHDTRSVGVWGSSVDADLRDVVIENVHASSFLYGRGLEVNGQSTLFAPWVRIKDCADVGLAMFSSVGTLGPGLELRSVVRGLLLSKVPEGGLLADGFTIEDTSAVAILIGADSKNVTVRNGVISGTRMFGVPVDIGGIEQVGDGIEWASGAQALVEDSVHISQSGRRPAVLGAGARGTFAATLGGGDETRGVFVLDPSGSSKHPELTIAPGIKVEYGSTVPIAIDPGTSKP